MSSTNTPTLLTGPPSDSASTRTSIDTIRSGTPSVSASPLPSRSPVPSRSSSRTASVSSLTAAANIQGAGSITLQPPTAPSRRNRTALRDYYGLKKQADSTSDSPDISKESSGVVDSSSELVVDRELDAPNFDADGYVHGLLKNQGLEALLRAESGLINEIKFLTSERAALVYDNYSKLIAATDTIQRMRSNMEPLVPATSTLAPAVAHIAGTAEQLAFKVDSPRAGRQGSIGGSVGSAIDSKEESKEEREKRQRDRDTVRWVLDTPRRIREVGPEQADWKTVKGLLDRWTSIRGIADVRKACEKAIEEKDPMNE